MCIRDRTENTDTLNRWATANSQVGNYFYIVQKVFTGYASASPQPDSWHQYGPATSYGTHGTYACLLYTSDAADERSSVDLGGRRIIKKKKNKKHDQRKYR